MNTASARSEPRGLLTEAVLSEISGRNRLELLVGFGHGVAATQVAADFVLPAENLSSITMAHHTALRAKRIVRQNLGFAAIYNLALIPVAVMGLATPLIAAAAMSASSIIVTLNALRARPAKAGDDA